MATHTKSNIEQYYNFWFGLNDLYALWAKRHGLTVNALFALYASRNIENCTQQDISKMLMLPKQTVNSLLNTLEQQGYITKTEHSSDKRCKVIVLAPLGREYADNVLAKLFTAESAALEAMTVEEMEGFLNGMAAFMKNFKQTSKI